MTTSDAVLAERAAGGDRRALEVLLDRHADRVHAVCRRIIAHPEDALDATQEAMIAIARGIRRFDGRAAFTTWCYRVATNAALDELRRKRRRPVPAHPDGPEPVAGGPSTEDRVGARLDVDAALARAPRGVPGRRGAARPVRPRLRRDRRRARRPARHRALAHLPWPRAPRGTPGSRHRPGTPSPLPHVRTTMADDDARDERLAAVARTRAARRGHAPSPGVDRHARVGRRARLRATSRAVRWIAGAAAIVVVLVVGLALITAQGGSDDHDAATPVRTPASSETGANAPSGGAAADSLSPQAQSRADLTPVDVGDFGDLDRTANRDRLQAALEGDLTAFAAGKAATEDLGRPRRAPVPRPAPRRHGRRDRHGHPRRSRHGGRAHGTRRRHAARSTSVLTGPCEVRPFLNVPSGTVTGYAPETLTGWELREGSALWRTGPPMPSTRSRTSSPPSATRPSSPRRRPPRPSSSACSSPSSCSPRVLMLAIALFRGAGRAHRRGVGRLPDPGRNLRARGSVRVDTALTAKRGRECLIPTSSSSSVPDRPG